MGPRSVGAAFVAVCLCTAGLLFPPGVGRARPATARPATANAAASSIGALSRITGPRIETSVVAMSLRGTGPLDELTVPDLDIVERVDGARYLPLVRILRVLGIEPFDSASVLVFVPDRAPMVTVDYLAETASIGGSAASVPMLVGISDVTNQPELYVEESALATILSMNVVWDARLYEYDIHSERALRVFELRRGLGGPGRASMFASYDLPGRLAPARARRSVLPAVQFVEAQWLSSLTAGNRTTGLARSAPVPRLGLWADVLDGNLAARATQKSSSNAPGYKVDQLLWSASSDQTALSVGSVNLGLSELVFPSLSLIGAVSNGRVGTGLGPTDPSQLGRQQAFMPLYVFDGFARIGSEVTLSINGQDLETRKVEPGPDAPPGDGPYRFEGVNLFSGRLNDVRIRVVTPDGYAEETQRRVLGTNQLMRAGDLAFIGGLGGRRDPASDDYAARGRFGGGRLNLGIARRLMLGMSAAYQDRLFERDQFFSFGAVPLVRAPARSTHVGSRLAWQPIDPLLVSAEAASSHSSLDSATGGAVRLDADYQLGELRVHPAAFHYGPKFFDGQNPDQRDLSGVSIGLLWRYRRGDQIGLGASRVRDDLDGMRVPALHWSELQAGWSMHGVLPHAVLTMGARRLSLADAPALATGLLGLEGTLPRGWGVRGQYEFGDDISGILQKRLPGRSTWPFDFSNRVSSVPEAGAGIGMGSQTSAMELFRRLGESWQVSLADRTLGPLHRTSVDLSRSVSSNGWWQARCSPGYEWDNRSVVLQNRLELFLRGSRDNRLVFEHQMLHHEWYVRASVQVQLDAGFVGARPVPLLGSQFDPGSGGVKGRVFLDANGNGLPDRGEPGLGGIDVTTDQGRGTVTKTGGYYVIPNTSALRRTRVSLQPDMLPATYSLTQGTQEAILRPGEFSEVNLGIAVLGSITGSVVAESAPGGPAGTPARTGVAGMRVLLVDETGREVGNSITGRDGAFTIDDIKPGRYVLRPDEATAPAKFELAAREIPVEVKSEVEPVERGDLNFTGRYTDLAGPAQRTEDSTGVVYKLFSSADELAAVTGPPSASPSRPDPPADTLGVIATAAPARAPEPADAGATMQPPSPGADTDSRLLVAHGRRLEPSASPAPPAPQAPQAAPAPPCECQVEGSVEIRSEDPLSRPVVVTVSLRDAAACRDSVELFMGAPRTFNLGPVPCGSHELVIRTSTSKRFTSVAPIPATFDCIAGRRQQLRVVLEPR